MSTKIKNKVLCDCKICNGKFVEERTRKSHIELEQRLAYSVSSFVPSLPGNKCDKQAYTAPEIDYSPVAERSSRSKKRIEEGSISFNSNYMSDFAVFVPQKGGDKTSFENRKSISMKIQVMMKAIDRLTRLTNMNMNTKVTHLQTIKLQLNNSLRLKMI